ncbi:hypothetical protein MPER_08448 [Moniliophthora perniciosa FA553]|nr:hypothetical protein MPER_08448 [Moniliophthora perniciosa FA553]
MNKAIAVQDAFKKDGKVERHETSPERVLDAQARTNSALPVAARPPAAPMAFGARPPMPGFQGPYQGQFAGALAQPPPPPGFTPQQTVMPPGMPMPMGAPPGMAPPGMAPMQGMQPPPMQPPMTPQMMYGGFPPPPPPGFNAQGFPQAPPPPPQFPQ